MHLDTGYVFIYIYIERMWEDGIISANARTDMPGRMYTLFCVIGTHYLPTIFFSSVTRSIPLCNHSFHTVLGCSSIPIFQYILRCVREIRLFFLRKRKRTHIFYYKTNYDKILQVVKWKMKNVKMKMSRNSVMTKGRVIGKQMEEERERERGRARNKEDSSYKEFMQFIIFVLDH